ncbi:prostaglandin E2 receptor EP3 subtype [Ornithorhynchus anatinus]|uniref:Thromboxane A2 receptor n=1 Tax=Ornithorhynchus anatinus TaxID=9258 RepID=A0A6I8PAV4_ORNAN|nr:prostaglandin E2 receptor EP3 subtype [Ornithorhynchus anatinus]
MKSATGSSPAGGRPNASQAGNWSAGPGSPAGSSLSSVSIPLAMMVTGLAGNTLALLLVTRSYRRRESRRRRSFLLGIGGLALTDLAGQLLTSPVVIAVYLSGQSWHWLDPSGRLCDFFGLSMTAFGLCPLFLAGAMAVERALAIGAPHWYSAHLRGGTPRAVLLGAWMAGLAFALLPLVGVGQYGVQWPGTWCFISTAGGQPQGGRTPRGRRFFAASFAGLGLTALAVTFAGNLATIRAVVARCGAGAGAKGPPGTPTQPGARWGRITTETVIQLMGIMCVLSVCWTPLLIMMLKMIFNQSSMEPCPFNNFQPVENQKECNLFLMAIRLASLNQILDPWVYLLLRRILLQKFCQIANAISCCSKSGQKGQPISMSDEVTQTGA